MASLRVALEPEFSWFFHLISGPTWVGLSLGLGENNIQTNTIDYGVGPATLKKASTKSSWRRSRKQAK